MDIFAQNYKELRKYAKNLAKDPVLADDVLHEAYLAFYKVKHIIDSFEGCKASVKYSWLNHIKQDYGYSIAKPTRLYELLVQGYNDDLQLKLDPVYLDIEEKDYMKNVIRNLYSCGIPKEHAKMLELKYQGYEYAEIFSSFNMKVPKNPAQSYKVRQMRKSEDKFKQKLWENMNLKSTFKA